METSWQPIESAPKDGQMVFSLWDGHPVLIAWMSIPAKIKSLKTGIWPFKKQHTEKIRDYEEGWRICMLGRSGDYGIHGNYAPFQPESWLPYTDEQISSAHTEPNTGDRG